MHNLRKRAIVAILGCAAVTLGACGSSSKAAAPGSSSAPSSTSSGASTTSSGPPAGTLPIYLSSDVNIENLYDHVLIPAFEKRYPQVKVKLVWSSHGEEDATTFARLTAAVHGGHYPGIGLYDAGFVTEAATLGLLQPVSHSEIPRVTEIPSRDFKPVDSAALPYRGSEVLIGYDSAKVTNPPTSIKALVTWIKSHPGKFTYNTPPTGGAGQAFIEAVLNLYVPKSDQKKMEYGYDQSAEKYWAKGFALLHSLTPDMYGHGVYPNGNVAVMDLLANGSIWVAPVWSDQSTSAIEKGVLPKTTKLLAPEPPFLGGPAYLGVPKTAPAGIKKDAYAWENFILGDHEQVSIYKTIAGFPAVKASYVPDLSQSIKKLIGNYSLPYSQKTLSDMERLWQSKVPG